MQQIAVESVQHTSRFLKSTEVLPSHLHLGLLCGLFPSGFQAKEDLDFNRYEGVPKIFRTESVTK